MIQTNSELDKCKTMTDLPKLSALLLHFMRSLEACGVRYCVLRNYEGLPRQTGRDTDILVNCNHSECEQILKSSLIEYDCQIVRKVSRNGCYSYHLAGWENGARVWGQIDIINPLNWRGLTYADALVVLRSRNKYRGIWVAAAGCEAAISLVKELLPYRHVKEKYKLRIQEYARIDGETFVATLASCIGKHTAKTLRDLCAVGDWERVIDYAQHIRYALLWYSYRKHPIETIRNQIAYANDYLGYRFLCPTGLFVCLIGPDGSGKTTISQVLKEGVGKHVFEGHRYYHGQFGIFPGLKKFTTLLRSKSSSEDKDRAEHVNADPSAYPAWRSTLYAVYYGIEYFFGSLLLAAMKRRGRLIIFDRYFYDFYIQGQHRKIPTKLLNIIRRFVPKPDLIVWLQSESAIIYARKPELSISELERQIAACEKLIMELPNSRRVRTDIEFSETVILLEQTIFDRLRQKMSNKCQY